jgi:hypothetical protein
MKLYCVVDGCPNFVIVNNAISPESEFTCKEHNAPGPDNVRFQESQFSRDLPRGTTYIDHKSIEFLDLATGIYGSASNVITKAPNIDGPGDDDPADHLEGEGV